MANRYANHPQTGDFDAADLTAASRKTVLLMAAILAGFFILNLVLAVGWSSLAHGAELDAIVSEPRPQDAPRQLLPRFDTESNSAPLRGRREHSPQLASSVNLGQCARIRAANERKECLKSPNGAPVVASLPSTPVSGAMILDRGTAVAANGATTAQNDATVFVSGN